MKERSIQRGLEKMAENKKCCHKRSGNGRQERRADPMSKKKELEGRVPGQESITRPWTKRLRCSVE